MSRTLKVTGNHVMYDRGAWFLRVIMSSSRALCCLPSVKKQKHDFQVCFVDRARHRKSSWRQGLTNTKRSTKVAKELFADYVKEKKLREPEEKKDLAQTLKTCYVEARKKGFVQCIIKQLLDSVFVISRIIKVSVGVISRSRRLITKPSSNNSCFLAWGFKFMLLCSFTKKKTGSVFPAFCHATFHHALIKYCNVSRAGYIAWCIAIGINLILVKAMWPRINQWQSLFS